MSLIPFPDVPDAPGVPPVPRSPDFTPNETLGLGFLQSIIWRAFQVDIRWGIFDSAGRPLGNPSLFTDFITPFINTAGLDLLQSTSSTASLEYSKETRVADFPIESGSFSSYDKVELSSSPTVVLCLSGSENDRRVFLDSIDSASKSTDLYSIVTPEVTYINYNIERYRYSRLSSNGATLLKVEITLKEIRQVSAIFTQSSTNTAIDKPKDPSATPQVDTGKVQPQPPPQSTLKSLANNFPSLFP